MCYSCVRRETVFNRHLDPIRACAHTPLYETEFATLHISVWKSTLEPCITGSKVISPLLLCLNALLFSALRTARRKTKEKPDELVSKWKCDSKRRTNQFAKARTAPRRIPTGMQEAPQTLS
jgi:hypothetical protein